MPRFYYYDDAFFRKDISSVIGDFLGDIIADCCDVIDNYSNRKLLKGESKFALESAVSAYLNRRKSAGLKKWEFQFYKENEKIKIQLYTLFTYVETNINVLSMKMEFLQKYGKVRKE